MLNRLGTFALLLSLGIPALAHAAKGLKDVQVFAPGRVEIIGGHTDYNRGFVIAMPLESAPGHRTGATVRLKWNAKASDGRVRIVSRAISGGNESVLENAYLLGQEARVSGWTDYFQGTTAIFSRPEYRKRFGLPRIPRGFTLEVASDVPLGAGLSSSAAILVAELRALRAGLGLEGSLDDVAIAQLGQGVEREFVGANVGLMDHLTISASPENRGMLLMDFSDDARPRVQPIPIGDDAELIVFNSGVKHSLSDTHGENFNTRREEVTDALARIRASRRSAGGVIPASLSDLGLEDLDSPEVRSLPENLFRRVRHVVTENARVLSFKKALDAGDWETAGRLLFASHDSARDDYRITVPEIDAIVESVRRNAPPEIASKVFGARLVGGGFGGSVLIAVRKGAAAEVSRHVEQAYAREIERLHSGEEPSRRPKGKFLNGPAYCGSLLKD